MWAYSRIDTVRDPKQLELIRKAGIKWLALGIESSSKHVRDGVVKGRFNNYDIEGIVKKVRDMGFFVTWVDEEDKESEILYPTKNKRYSRIPKSPPNSDEDPWI